MAVHVACPKCDFVLQRDTGASVPSHCPACGMRLTCPRCGSRVDQRPHETALFHCPHCQADLAGVDTAPLKQPSQTVGDFALPLAGFEVRGELGRGGMGIVYRAWQRSLHREVAIKVLPPALASDPYLLQRFRNEAAVAAGLVDAHILPVFDVQEVQGVPVIVMPLIAGSDLGRIVRDRLAAKQGRAPAQPHPWAHVDDRAYLNQLLPLLDQVVAAVAALHRGGVLHRDIKPSNVLVDGQGNPWLSDFGLARLEEQGAGTRPSLAMGTPAFVSPEQARGEEEIDFRADLFSLGATLYQALTLELPYGKAGVAATTARPPAPSRKQPLLPQDFDAVILKALERDRAQRYSSAVELQDDWRLVRQGLLPRTLPAGPARRIVRAVRRHPGRVVAGLVMALLVGLLGLHRSNHGS